METEPTGIPADAIAAVYFQWFGYGYFYSRTPGHV